MPNSTRFFLDIDYYEIFDGNAELSVTLQMGEFRTIMPPRIGEKITIWTQDRKAHSLEIVEVMHIPTRPADSQYAGTAVGSFSSLITPDQNMTVDPSLTVTAKLIANEGDPFPIKLMGETT